MFLVLAAALPFAYDGNLRAGQSLTIRDINGGVRVRTGERLAIRATKRAERGDPNEVAIHVDTHPEGILVCVRYPPDAASTCAGGSHHDNKANNTVVDFDVTVPHGIVLDANTVNGSVDAVNDGPTDASSVNGTVRVEGRDVRSAQTVNGSVIVRIRNRARGTLEARTVNGAIEVSLPAGSGVDLEAKTLTGEINADGVSVERPRFGPGSRASATIGDGARRLRLETVNGSITVRR